MKKLFFIPTIIAAFVFSSCTEENDEGSISDALLEQIDADSEAALEANYEDIEMVAEAGLASLSDEGRVERDTLLNCAEVDHDTENKTMIIDYGDGCTIRGGRVLSGRIIIAYNERRLEPGASRTVTLENFFVDEVQVEGTRSWTNISKTIEDNPKFNTQLVGGKLTFSDGTIATREANHTKEWLRASNPLDDESLLDGSAEGVNRENITYQVEILETLVYKRTCRAEKVFVPVSGIKQITKGEDIAIINYGEGECDNEVTITLNGETFTKIIEPRGKRRK
ncbi:MAG: hypothetical protein AB8B73_00790 [Ekhidna sp.]